MTRDIDGRLRAAIERSADAAGIDLTVTASATTRWASATFAGARHELTLALPASAAAERWLADLPEAELAVRGHLIADLKIVAAARAQAAIAVTLEVLSVEDR